MRELSHGGVEGEYFGSRISGGMSGAKAPDLFLWLRFAGLKSSSPY